jgi:hypothetical protein
MSTFNTMGCTHGCYRARLQRSREEWDTHPFLMILPFHGNSLISHLWDNKFPLGNLQYLCGRKKIINIFSAGLDRIPTFYHRAPWLKSNPATWLSPPL